MIMQYKVVAKHTKITHFFFKSSEEKLKIDDPLYVPHGRHTNFYIEYHRDHAYRTQKWLKNCTPMFETQANSKPVIVGATNHHTFNLVGHLFKATQA